MIVWGLSSRCFDSTSGVLELCNKQVFIIILQTKVFKERFIGLTVTSFSTLCLRLIKDPSIVINNQA